MIGQALRIATFALCAYTVGESAAIALRLHPLPWHQKMRFIALAVLLGSLGVFQSLHWHRPVTTYAAVNFVAVVLAAGGTYGMRRDKP